MNKKKIVKRQWQWFAMCYIGILLFMGQVAFDLMSGTFLGLSPKTLQIMVFWVGFVAATVGAAFHTYYRGWWTWRKPGDPERIPFGI